MLEIRTQLLAPADGIGVGPVCAHGVVMPSRGSELNPAAFAVGGGGPL